MVDAVAELGVGVGYVVGSETAVRRGPRLAAVVRAERSRSGDRDVNPVGIGRIDDDRVQAQPARAWVPVFRGVVCPDAVQLSPRGAPVRRLEQRRVLDPRVYVVRIVE